MEKTWKEGGQKINKSNNDNDNNTDNDYDINNDNDNDNDNNNDNDNDNDNENDTDNNNNNNNDNKMLSAIIAINRSFAALFLNYMCIHSSISSNLRTTITAPDILE